MTPLDRLRVICLALPEVTERLSHGEPTWFIQGIKPPYVGVRGWLGVWVDVEVDWAEVARLVETAYRTVAPKRLLAQFDSMGP
jgi:hypothetical protein